MDKKKFIKDAETEFDNSDVWLSDARIAKAVGMMLAHKDNKGRISSEAIGVAKVLRLSVKLGEFYKKLEEEGRTEYQYSEEYEFIKDILNA